MQQLAAKVPSAKLGITYTAENDPNHLLGRPNGYASGPNVRLLFGTVLALTIAAMAGLGAT